MTGALFGFVGFAVLRVVNGALAYIYGLLAVMLALTGLALLRFIRITLPVHHPTARPVQSFFASHALCPPFGLSTCPACTPLLLPVVVAASASADPVMGMVIMGSFGLTRGIPIVIAGTVAARLCASQAHAPFHAVGRAGGGRAYHGRGGLFRLPGRAVCRLDKLARELC